MTSWITHPWRGPQPLATPWSPTVGWLTYLIDVQPHSLKAGTMEAMDGGSLVWATDDYSLVTVDRLLAVRVGP